MTDDICELVQTERHRTIRPIWGLGPGPVSEELIDDLEWDGDETPKDTGVVPIEEVVAIEQTSSDTAEEPL